MKTKKSDKANLENKRGIFFIVGLIISAGMVFLAFEWESEYQPVLVKKNVITDIIEYDYVPLVVEKKPEIHKRMVEPPIIEIVGNEVEVPDNVEFAPSEIGEEPIDFNLPLLTLPDEPDHSNEVLITAEQMPEFPGGELALRKYLADAVNYPVIAQENGIQGKVYISFVINEKGGIEDVALLRGVDISLDNEALRVVRSLPRWKPGKQGGKTVKVRYSVPILFELR